MHHLSGVQGILVPGGFGERGAEGKIAAAKFAREHNVPYFGICFGMQMAVIEAARSLAGITRAGSTEFGKCEEPIVGLMTEWLRGDKLERRSAEDKLGGTMRLGAYDCHIEEGSLAKRIYDEPLISERIVTATRSTLTIANNLRQLVCVFSGLSPDGVLPEIVELHNHPGISG